MSSHLAAHEQNISKRNRNFDDILRRATFGAKYDENGEVAAGLNILDHDVVFWLGDMNYRISLSVKEVSKRAIRAVEMKRHATTLAPFSGAATNPWSDADNEFF